MINSVGYIKKYNVYSITLKILKVKKIMLKDIKIIILKIK